MVFLVSTAIDLHIVGGTHDITASKPFHYIMQETKAGLRPGNPGNETADTQTIHSTYLSVHREAQQLKVDVLSSAALVGFPVNCEGHL